MATSEFAIYINPLISALKMLGGSARPGEVCAFIADQLKLPDQLLDRKLKSGLSRYENQVHWARFFLAKTGYIDSSKQGVWTLTLKGQEATQLTQNQLRDILQEVRAKYAHRRPGKHLELQPAPEPDEVSEQSLSDIDTHNYKEQLLSLLKSLPPKGFERICQNLLREAGFEEVTVTGRNADGGIDGHGVLRVNPFVSFQVIFQCKRYEGSVTPSQVRDFRGAMAGRADKGIILTTGTFTAESKREATRDGVQPIELVDGEKLIHMFRQFELGLKQRTTYDIDASFFESFKE